MQGTGQISLRARDILSMSQLRKSLERKAFNKFRPAFEGGCIPLHLPSRERESAVFILPAIGSPVKELELPSDVRKHADSIARSENDKLRERGVAGPWIDGDKLSVWSMGYIGSDISIFVKKMKWSEVLAIRELDFGHIAAMGAFRLGINNHLVAQDGGHPVIVLTMKGSRPGNPRMGDAMIKGAGEKEGQLMTSVSGSIDASLERKAGGLGLWHLGVATEMAEELGVSVRGSLKYLGTMIDASMYRGTITIAGMAETDLSLLQIDELRECAPDGTEIKSIEPLPLEPEAVSSALSRRRGEMQPQLITALALLGYGLWGYDFLKKADK